MAYDRHGNRLLLVTEEQVRAMLKDLRAEIARRRKENKDAYRVRGNSDAIAKREQSDLLDWIEEQLDRMPES